MDVDGVLNVSAAASVEIRELGLESHRAVAETGQAYRMLINPRAGAWLLSLTDSFELVWCTTWQNANEAISPLVGLPRNLRSVPLPRSWRHEPSRRDWSPKVPYIRDWAAHNGIDRLAWIDDDIRSLDARVLSTDFTRQRGHSMAGNPPLLDVLALKIPPHRGLEAHHLARLREWAQ